MKPAPEHDLTHREQEVKQLQSLADRRIGHSGFLVVENNMCYMHFPQAHRLTQ